MLIFFVFQRASCPDHIDRIPRFTSTSTTIHPVLALEMTDDRLDLNPLLGAIENRDFSLFG
jgi:hypothetical protein